MDFWSRLKTEVRNQNTTQAWVSEKSGIPFGTFQRWLSHKTMPNADQAVAIAETLGVSVEYLITGKDKSDPWIMDNLNLIKMIKNLPDETFKEVKEFIEFKASKVKANELTDSQRIGIA